MKNTDNYKNLPSRLADNEKESNVSGSNFTTVSELDGQQKNVGSQDESKNYYSLGEYNHNLHHPWLER